MNVWVPYAAFFATAVFAVVAEGLYFRALTKPGLGIRDDNEVAAEIRSAPSRLPLVVAIETGHRLRALASRQADPSLERKRVLACVAIGLAIAAFVWGAVS